MDEKKAKKQGKRMNENEYQLNKQLLKEITVKRKTGGDIESLA
jgi:hypothetical protein